MPVKVAEYFGQNTESESPIIPVKDEGLCPFMNDTCIKLSQGHKPVCTVRKNNGDLWIVCRNRLCATKNKIPLTIYQQQILFEVSKLAFGNDVLPEDIAVKREVTIPVVENSKYHADYIMINRGSRGRNNGPKRVVLEMQGGGETSNTGSLTRNIQAWEENQSRTNSELSSFVNANPIVTNAWRRQQEQFIVKGNIAMQTGGGIVFCVGKPLYDYLLERTKKANLNDLKNHNWSLALIAFKEKNSNEKDGPLFFEIDENRVLFTNYISFVQTLINQGGPYPQMFQGEFESLDGDMTNIT